MAVILVTYDLKQPGRNYGPLHAYLKVFTHCKELESVWLLDTSATPEAIRDGLKPYIDSNDILFVTKLAQSWASFNYNCSAWLNSPARSW